MSYIIAFSGTHGTGKTTSAAEKFVELKKKHPDKSIKLLSDLEAMCPYPFGKGKCSLKTQLWMFYNIALQELKYMSRFDIVVSDRTIIDPIVYSAGLGYHSLSESMMAMVSSHLWFYQEIYLKKAKNNEYCFKDGIRDIDDQYRLDVDEIFIKLYKKVLTIKQFRGKFEII